MLGGDYVGRDHGSLRPTSLFWRQATLYVLITPRQKYQLDSLVPGERAPYRLRFPLAAVVTARVVRGGLWRLPLIILHVTYSSELKAHKFLLVSRQSR